jgi:hypothetical protein
MGHARTQTAKSRCTPLSLSSPSVRRNETWDRNVHEASCFRQTGDLSTSKQRRRTWQTHSLISTAMGRRCVRMPIPPLTSPCHLYSQHRSKSLLTSYPRSINHRPRTRTLQNPRPQVYADPHWVSRYRCSSSLPFVSVLWVLRRLPYRRRPPTHQRSFPCLVCCHAVSVVGGQCVRGGQYV